MRLCVEAMTRAGSRPQPTAFRQAGALTARIDSERANRPICIGIVQRTYSDIRKLLFLNTTNLSHTESVNFFAVYFLT